MPTHEGGMHFPTDRIFVREERFWLLFDQRSFAHCRRDRELEQSCIEESGIMEQETN